MNLPNTRCLPSNLPRNPKFCHGMAKNSFNRLHKGTNHSFCMALVDVTLREIYTNIVAFTRLLSNVFLKVLFVRLWHMHKN
jgi:hypothetical protein